MIPHGKVEDFEGQITPSARVLDQSPLPVEEKRPVDIQVLFNSELERISCLDFSFSTDNLSNDHKHSPIPTPPIKHEPSPSPSRLPDEKQMEQERSSTSRPTRGAADAPRGRQPRQVSPHNPRSRSMSSSSTDASAASSRPPHAGISSSRNVAGSAAGMSSGSMFSPSGPFLHPSFPPTAQNLPQLYSQLVGAGDNGTHPPSLSPQQAFAGAQPPSSSAPFTPAIFALPGVDYGSLTPQQQQMLVQVHQQLLLVAVQQQQQRQQHQQTPAHLPPLDVNQWSHLGQYQQQQPPNVFERVPHASELPSTTFPHQASTADTRHDGTYQYSPPATVSGAGLSPDARSFPQPNLSGVAGGSGSRAPAAASRGSSWSGPGPSSGDAATLDDGDDADDAESPHGSEDKRTRNTAASARFRLKKKQRTIALERTIGDLEGRADDLEKEAGELRKENSWLKEMVIMKGRRAMVAAHAGEVGHGGADAIGGAVAVASSSTGGIAPTGASTSTSRGGSGTVGRRGRSRRTETSSRRPSTSQNVQGDDDEDEDEDSD